MQRTYILQLLLGGRLKADYLLYVWFASEYMILVDNDLFTNIEKNVHAKYLEGSLN